MCTNLTHDYFKERSKTVDLFLISDGDLLSISELKQNKNHDVIIIIGHSSVSNIGRLQTSDVLNIFIQSPQPSIIAILGCCGGNNRYGPLFMLSHWKHKTIYGFYQRMVSTDELNESSLILGIRNYLCLSKYREHRHLDRRIIAKQAFVYGVLEAPAYDPTAFANDNDKAITIQSFLKAFGTTYMNIPESCKGLATYHIYIKEGIEQFFKEITETEFDIQEVDKKCKDEYERLNLHKIIPRVIDVIEKSLGEISTIQEETIHYLRNGEWNKVSDMQLFAAISQGYWGKNSYKAIMDFAYIHDCVTRGTNTDSVVIMNCVPLVFAYCVKTHI